VQSRLALLFVLLGAVAFVGAGPGIGAPPQTQCAPAAKYPAATTPVAFWSTEARCAIVPAGPGGIFGSENFGNKFPGEAAVYMGIVHVAIYDAAVALEGRYRPYVPTPRCAGEHLSRGRDRDRSVRHTHRHAAAAWRRPDHPRRRLHRLHGCHPRWYSGAEDGQADAPASYEQAFPPGVLLTGVIRVMALAAVLHGVCPVFTRTR
jgi:hypothetical protein